MVPRTTRAPIKATTLAAKLEDIPAARQLRALTAAVRAPTTSPGGRHADRKIKGLKLQEEVVGFISKATLLIPPAKHV